MHNATKTLHSAGIYVNSNADAYWVEGWNDKTLFGRSYKWLDATTTAQAYDVLVAAGYNCKLVKTHKHNMRLHVYS